MHARDGGVSELARAITKAAFERVFRIYNQSPRFVAVDVGVKAFSRFVRGCRKRWSLRHELMVDDEAGSKEGQRCQKARMMAVAKAHHQRVTHHNVFDEDSWMLNG